MDHDDELLLQEIVRANRIERVGPIPEFLAKKEAEQAVKTVAEYKTALLRFRDFLGEEGTVGDVTESAGFRFLSHLKELGLSQNTQAAYIKCLKVFTHWMHKKGWTERNRFEDVKRPKTTRPRFDTLTQEEKQAILSDFNPETFLGARNIAIFCVFLDTGVRLGELVRLKTERVHLTEGYIEVWGQKTQEWRIIPMSAESIQVCRHYLTWRAKFRAAPIRHRASHGDVNHRILSDKPNFSDTFFVSVAGQPLKENGVGLMVSRLRRRLAAKGVVMPLHAHLLRHNFLTEKALDGENPSMVRRWAGHKSYEMTDYYFGLAEQKMAAIKPKQSTLAGLSIVPVQKGPRSIRSARSPGSD